MCFVDNKIDSIGSRTEIIYNSLTLRNSIKSVDSLVMEIRVEKKSKKISY